MRRRRIRRPQRYKAPHKRYPPAGETAGGWRTFGRRFTDGVSRIWHIILLPLAALIALLAGKSLKKRRYNAPLAVSADGVMEPPAEILRHYPERDAPKTRVSRIFDIVLLAAIVLGALFFSWAVLFSDTSIDVVVERRGQARTIRTKAQTVGELLESANITLARDDTLNVEEDAPLQPDMRIVVTSAFPIAIASKGEVQILRLQSGSVGEALELAGISYDANDELSRLPFEDLEPGMYIRHIDVEVEYETTDQAVPYREEIIKDANRYNTSDPIIKTEGKDGEKRTVHRLIYKDGMLASREVMNQITLSETVNEVKIVGSKTRYQTSFKGDDRIWKPKPKGSDVKQTMVVYEVTAYTHTGRKTATGKWPKIGYVAVNPNVIPYGTKLYIPGYGYCTAQDTGAFRFEQDGKKNQIDIFLNTEAECKKWGRKRNVTIQILK